MFKRLVDNDSDEDDGVNLLDDNMLKGAFAKLSKFFLSGNNFLPCVDLPVNQF